MRLFVTANAEYKYELGRKLTDASEPLVDHLIKIFMYPNHVSVDHWIQEVYGFLNKVGKLKHNNKFPSARFILNSTWGVHGDIINESIPVFESDYCQPTHNSSSEIADAVRCYFLWLSYVLSANGRVAKQDVINRIHAIIDAYQFV